MCPAWYSFLLLSTRSTVKSLKLEAFKFSVEWLCSHSTFIYGALAGWIYFHSQLKGAIRVLDSGCWVSVQSSLGIFLLADNPRIVMERIVVYSSYCLLYFFLTLTFKVTLLIFWDSEIHSLKLSADTSCGEACNVNLLPSDAWKLSTEYFQYSSSLHIAFIFRFSAWSSDSDLSKVWDSISLIVVQRILQNHSPSLFKTYRLRADWSNYSSLACSERKLHSPDVTHVHIGDTDCHWWHQRFTKGKIAFSPTWLYENI